MPKHQAASKELLDRAFAQQDYIIQKNRDLLRILKKIDIANKDIIHLCCNNGVELLSLKNMGAGRCTGVDFCEIAIAEARERSAKFHISCEFVCANVFDIPERYFSCYDIVHITAGCIGWIPNLNQFFKIARRLLKADGIFLIHEIHPFSEMLPFDSDDNDNRLQIVEPYFRNGPIIENSSLDYVGGTDYEAKTQYWFVHSMATIINSLANNQFFIDEWVESPEDISAGHKSIENMKAGIPLSMIITARKAQ